VGEGTAVLQEARVPTDLPTGGKDPGVVLQGDVTAFLAALAQHRLFDRELDPPAV